MENTQHTPVINRTIALSTTHLAISLLMGSVTLSLFHVSDHHQGSTGLLYLLYTIIAPPMVLARTTALIQFNPVQDNYALYLNALFVWGVLYYAILLFPWLPYAFLRKKRRNIILGVIFLVWHALLYIIVTEPLAHRISGS